MRYSVDAVVMTMEAREPRLPSPKEDRKKTREDRRRKSQRR